MPWADENLNFSKFSLHSHVHRYFLMQWSCEELCVRNYYMELCVGYMVSFCAAAKKMGGKWVTDNSNPG